MRKMFFAILVALLCLGGDLQNAWADGAILPLDAVTANVAVRYHHVTVNIHDQHAVTHVEQEFFNPNPTPVAGRYLFPIPPDAILSRFSATLDGQLQPAVRQGQASTNTALYGMVATRRDPRLLQYVDWETVAFDVSLAPHASRHMTLEYEEVLAPAGGLYHYRYVLSTESYSAQPLAQVSLTINLASADGLGSIYSSSHPALMERLGPGQARVRWSAENATPSEDFDLFYAPARNGFGAGLLTGRRAGEDHFLFMFTPAPAQSIARYLPKDVVFIVDRSGSMAGEKIGQVQEALRYFLEQLGEDDRYAIVSFNHELTVVPDTLTAPSQVAIAGARRYVDALEAAGNTDLDSALQAGLAVFGRSPRRAGALRLAVFLTDGVPTAGVMNPDSIAQRVDDANHELGVRVHAFGVGYDVNSHLLDRLAADGAGSVSYVQPGESLEAVLTGFYDRIARPVLSDVTVTFDGLAPRDLYPNSLPDLFEGSSLLVTGRYTPDGGPVTVHVRGRAPEGSRTYTYTFDLNQTGGHDFVPRLWATRRVGELLDRVRVDGESTNLVAEVRKLGLTYGLVTPYTGAVIMAQPDGAASVSNMALYRNQQALNQATGQVSIQARVQNQAYQAAQQADFAQGSNVLNRQQFSLAQIAGPSTEPLNVDLTVLQRAGLQDNSVTADWIEHNLRVDEVVDFASPRYFELAADPEARPRLTAGVNVIFDYGGKLIRVQGQGVATQDKAKVHGQWNPGAVDTLFQWLGQLFKGQLRQP